MKNKLVLSVYTLTCVLIMACGNSETPHNNIATVATATTPSIAYKIDTLYPHDINSFTEGLLVHKGKIYESTGSPKELPQTKSVYGELDKSTGQIKVLNELDRSTYFGEGICILNDKLYQLTYQNGNGFVYDLKSHKQLGSFQLPSKEGWGMTTDGTSLIISDGSYKLYFLNPADFSVSKTLIVGEQNVPLEQLNELEYIKGYIYANVFTTDYIVKINPEDGKVVGKINCSDLLKQAKQKNLNTMEMNGIAYDSLSNKLLLTGKMWPMVFQVSLVE